MKTFVLGTRGSALAIRQTEDIVGRLRRAHPEMEFSLELIKTAADRRPGSPFEDLGGIGFFVKELEVALQEGRIDAAVHSMKDLPTTDTLHLMVAAIAQREDPRDVLVARKGATLESLPLRARVGTSSPRRAAFLLAARADLEIVPIRGNVETRVRKVDAGELDAVCLAAAGLRRLGLDERISVWLPPEVMLPAPGQGALGVQVRDDNPQTASIVAAADDAQARITVEAERGVLRRLQGGCRLPMGAFADLTGGRVRLRAAVVSADGRTIIRSERSGDAADAAALGGAVGEDLLSSGAASMI
ncbi:MAG: hydroxymethylbilane synthase [bacterium]